MIAFLYYGVVLVLYCSMIPQTVLALRGSYGVGRGCYGSCVAPVAAAGSAQTFQITIQTRCHLQKPISFLTKKYNFCRKPSVFRVKNDRQPQFHAQGAQEASGSFRGASGSFQGASGSFQSASGCFHQSKNTVSRFEK